jgi:hypothetical protein
MVGKEHWSSVSRSERSITQFFSSGLTDMRISSPKMLVFF